MVKSGVIKSLIIVKKSILFYIRLWFTVKKFKRKFVANEINFFYLILFDILTISKPKQLIEDNACLLM